MSSIVAQPEETEHQRTMRLFREMALDRVTFALCVVTLKDRVKFGDLRRFAPNCFPLKG